MVSILHKWRLALITSLVLGTLPAQAQKAPAAESTPPIGSPASSTPLPSALDGELFYELLVGEMSAAQGDFVNAIALLMEAARSSQDEAIYQRAAELALQSRAGPRALSVANEWQQNFPDSREANRFLLHVLLLLNRVSETQEPLAREVAWTDPAAKTATYLGILQLYGRVSDKALAAAVVEQALQQDLQNPKLAAAAWSTIGHMRLTAKQKDLALQALQHAHAAGSMDSATALLALELLQAGELAAEALVQEYMANDPAPPIQLAYARVLIGQNRIADAQQQLNTLLMSNPEMAEAWLVQASAYALQSDWKQALKAVRRVENLASKQSLSSDPQQEQVLSEAYLLGGRIAMQQKDYAQATLWLNKIPGSDNDLNIQSLKALALSKQGKLAQGRALIRAVPAQSKEQIIRKRQAEVALLRDSNAVQEAYLLQRTLYDQHPDNADIAYETAILAERAGKLEVMEKILQGILAKQPDYHHALNALGYSYADRGIRLPEAKELIEQALQLAPDDPFILDSLGWVEFRMGNHGKARELLEQAYAQRDDVEIAAHLGEVLWELGDKKRARKIWRKAMEADADNSMLRATLERLQVRP